MKASSRLQYLDWLRGLAVLLMIQVHVTDSFMRQDLDSAWWNRISQFAGGWAAPLFLFTAGVSLALVFDRMRSKGAKTEELIRRAVNRGGWILVLAFAFRIEQALVWYPYASWADVWKVDILNCIGVSYIVVGLMATRCRPWALAVCAAAVALVTPFTAHTGAGLLFDYIHGHGGGNDFPVFPWIAYVFAGAAIGGSVVRARQQAEEPRLLMTIAAAGVSLLLVGYSINHRPQLLFGLADYSRYSPHYVMIKMGYVLSLTCLAYLWSTRPTSSHWSPLVVFGQTSLLIYWLHIEFVYGRLRPFRNTLAIETTAAQLLWLVPLMLAIAAARLNWKSKRQWAARTA